MQQYHGTEVLLNKILCLPSSRSNRCKGQGGSDAISRRAFHRRCKPVSQRISVILAKQTTNKVQIASPSTRARPATQQEANRIATNHDTKHFILLVLILTVVKSPTVRNSCDCEMRDSKFGLEREIDWLMNTKKSTTNTNSTLLVNFDYCTHLKSAAAAAAAA